jgi:hypothetical protein
MIMSAWSIAVAVILLVWRLSVLRRFWRLPVNLAKGWFFMVEVSPSLSSDGVTGPLLREYRLRLLAPLLPDLLIMLFLIAIGKSLYLLHEQFLAILLTGLFYNLLFHHFAYRVRSLIEPERKVSVTAAQLLLKPRRLRDHLRWPVETIVIILTVAAVFLTLANHKSIFGLLWLVYFQIGLLLLKVVFVRWRMKLPLQRTEDYRRWRKAWLTYHLHVFDSGGVLIAVAALYQSTKHLFSEPIAYYGARACWVAGISLFIIYSWREYARLKIVRDEVQPVTLTREFPPSPIAEGRFFAGGLLYFNRDHPAVLARSPHGLAINLAHRSAYLWLIYLSGLILLWIWQIVR